MIERLRYVRVGVMDLPRAAAFAEEVLGLRSDRGIEHGRALFRSDERGYTLALTGDAKAGQAVGLALRDRAALDAVGERLHRRGRTLVVEDAAAAAERGAKALAHFEDGSGNCIELVVRPLDSGWRFHTARDSGVTGLEAVALRSVDVEADQAMWIEVLGAQASDWAGGSVYLALDEAHHRISLHPAATGGVLAVEYAVEDVDLLMQNSYFLQGAQVKTLHGPGRRPTSGQMFLTFETPFGVLASFVAEGERRIPGVARRPRQFPGTAISFDSWGSDNRLPDGLCGAAV